MNQKKVILISVDGMRPDGFLQCGNPKIHKIMEKAYYTLTGQTVFPSVTLPCHMSLFHSVTPDRHGVTTNLYTPMVRPMNGLFEQVATTPRCSAMFYGWEPLRDVSRTGSLRYAMFQDDSFCPDTDRVLTDYALKCIADHAPDLVFLYLAATDHAGHDYGWMTQKYLDTISNAVDQIQRVMDACGDTYAIVITADHGGHDRSHGLQIPEDMTIPMFYMGSQFTPGTEFAGGSILDITPTIAKILDVPPAREWEGTPII